MKNVEPKKIDIKEFTELGYLQEVNRQFLHPLGLALAIFINEDGEYKLDSIWDSRDDSQGFRYDLKNSSIERIKNFQRKFTYIQQQKEKFKKERLKVLGEDIESIPEIE
jgi:hypothetical protein